MIDAIGRANMDYMVRLANDPAWARNELEAISRYCAENGAVYGDKPVPVPVKPQFISPRQRQILERGLGSIHAALEKFILHWLETPALQDMWGVTPDELELYKIDPGYNGAIQVARFDAFLTDHDLKFLEFNCDSPGGTGYADVIHAAFLEMFDRNDMGGRYHVSNRQRMMHLAETLSAAYRQWQGDHPDHPERPFIVVSDWHDVGSRPDIDITLRHLNEAGLDTVFADPRDLELRQDGLYYDDRRIDMVYKRVIVKELVEEPAAAALTQAYKAGQICMVNSPRSVIVGNKKILAAIRHPDVMAKFSPEERTAIQQCVPWTEVFRDGKAECMGFTVYLPDFVRDNRDKLVLKAAQSYGGKDVLLGFETSQEEWEQCMDRVIDQETWIVQRLVEIPKELFPTVDGDEVKMDLMNVNINPLAFGGKYAGSYSRISKKNVINVSYGGGMTAAMTIEPREGAFE